MSAGVDILTSNSGGVVSIPIEAVTTREKEQEDDAVGIDELEEVVFVVRADTVDKVVVTTGLQDASVIEVKSGLEAGDAVVAGPYTAVSRNLKEGEKVIVKEKDKFYDDDNN
jgi:HlyD family secretion protein